MAGASLAAVALVGATLAATSGGTSTTLGAASADTTTPIKHLVVLFPENISFDHYFGTYPFAANDGTGPTFTPKAGTPIPKNYLKPTATSLSDLDPALTTNNPNPIKPFRLNSSQAWTCSQSHNYTTEQSAVDNGQMDLFSNNRAGSDNATIDGTTPAGTSSTTGCNKFNGIQLPDGLQQQQNGESMAYYDGNTVTAMWNYAQNYAMSDNAWANNFGPSTVGAQNLIAGQTSGAQYFSGDSTDVNRAPISTTTNDSNTSAFTSTDAATGTGTIIGDPQPAYDDCADSNHGYNPAAATPAFKTSGNGKVVGLTGKNIGDQLNAAGVTWGWFQGGFNPTIKYGQSVNGNPAPFAVCGAISGSISHNAGTGDNKDAGAGAPGYDYTPHHSPFEYYKSTSNPHHYPGTDGVAIGAPDPTNDTTHTGANHNYDLTVFDKAAKAGKLPAVSFVKPRYSQDGHPGNSTPLDEQQFLTNTINELEKGPEWSSTAIVITYDDSDGWYDHVAPTILNGSNVTHGNGASVADNGATTPGYADDLAICTNAAAANKVVPGADGQADRCGPSQRIPLLVISPYAKSNYVDDSLESQASVLKFIEKNWNVPAIGGGSFDSTPQFGDLTSLFSFSTAPQPNRVLLNSDGTKIVDPDEAVAPPNVVVPGATVTIPGNPGATVTVPPTKGPNSVACVKAKDKVTLFKAKHKKKLAKKAAKKAALLCKA